jgi:transketolase
MSALPVVSAREAYVARASHSWEEALLVAAERDERVIVMTAENRAPIRGVPAALGPRFVDVGICEQTLVGAAAGLALRGRRPVVHALATFLTLRAFEFIRTDVGLPRLPVILVGFVPGFLSEANGPTHQALEDVALMRGIPGMQVVCPANDAELVDCLGPILASNAPTYVRYNPTPAAAAHTPFVLGRAEIEGAAGRVALLTYGFLHREAVRAAAILRSRGVPVRLVNLRSLKPIDEAALVAAARESELVVTLEDHFRTGGLFTIAAETFLTRRLRPRLLPLSLEERFFKPLPLEDLLEHEGFTARAIVDRILEEL